MSRTRVAGWLVAGLVLAGCGQEGATPRAGDAAPGTAAAPGTPAPAAAAATPKLEDVIEQDPRYIVGISFPPVARKYPGLARLLEAYARDARAELMVAVSGLGASKPTAPYELSLAFSEVAATPRVVRTVTSPTPCALRAVTAPRAVAPNPITTALNRRP